MSWAPVNWIPMNRAPINQAPMNWVPMMPARKPTMVFASPPIPMTPLDSASWTSPSDSASSADVASSRIRIGESRRMARAIASR